MFCKQCGREIPDNANNCTYCGAPTGVTQTPIYTQPAAPVASSEADSKATAALIWGIVALCCCWGSVLGIIFGAIAMSNAKKAAALGCNDGKAKAGKVMGILALVGGIISTIVWIIVIATIGIAGCTLAGAGYGSY